MTSWLIDILLLGALAFTAWRCGAMVRELRRLRAESSGFRRMLAESDAAIERAARAIAAFRGEGMQTVEALQEAVAAGRAQTERLDHAIRTAELQLTLASVQARREAA